MTTRASLVEIPHRFLAAPRPLPTVCLNGSRGAGRPGRPRRDVTAVRVRERG